MYVCIYITKMERKERTYACLSVSYNMSGMESREGKVGGCSYRG